MRRSEPCLDARGAGPSAGSRASPSEEPGRALVAGLCSPSTGRALAAERVWALGDDIAVEAGDDAGPDRDGTVRGGAVSFLLQRRDRAGASTGENCAR